MKTYKGKTGVLVYILLVIYNILPLFFFITDFKGCFDTGLEIFIWILWYFLNIIFLPTIIRNKVVLDEEYLTYYYGFSKRKYKINDIVSITKGKGFIASSSNAINRIHIVPKDYQEFSIALKNNDEFIVDFNKLKENKKDI